MKPNDRPEEPGFRADSNVANIAEAYALDAIDLAKRNFRVKLDLSDASVESVERMLDDMHKQMGAAKPDEETIWTFAKSLGS